jgi:hypothetical protein
MKTFEEWLDDERRDFEAKEPATFTDTDEWLMKKGLEGCEYQFRSGHKGACPNCDSAGMLNKELEKKIKDLEYALNKGFVR